jgi:hypothetical protein
LEESKKILLNSFKNVDSVNTDIYLNVELKAERKQINEDIVNTFVSLSERFDYERQQSTKFRIYGAIEYFSFFNNIPINYTGTTDFFRPPIQSEINNDLLKNFSNSFKVYLCKLSYDSIDTLNNNRYTLYFDKITQLNDFDSYSCGYSVNLFNEKKLLYNFDVDIDINNIVDPFNKPLMDLYLYFEYIPTTTAPQSEFVRYTEYGDGETPTSYSYPVLNLPTTASTVYGNLVEYTKTNFIEETIQEQEYYVNGNYKNESLVDKTIILKYKPFHKIVLREFSENSELVYSGTTNVIIPSYSVLIENTQNYLWRDILDYGFIEPESLNGVDNPFVNGRHYVYTNIVLDMKPDLTNTDTRTLFSQIYQTGSTNISNSLTNNFEAFNKPC